MSGRPPSEAAEIIGDLLRTTHAIEFELDVALRPFDVTLTQFVVLDILRKAPHLGFSMAQIIARMVHPVPALTRVIFQLSIRGRVRSQRHHDDLRKIRVNLTDVGSALLAKTAPVVEQVYKTRTRYLSPRARKDLRNSLAVIMPQKPMPQRDP